MTAILTTIATQKGLDSQGFRCAACKAPVGISKSKNDYCIRVYKVCIDFQFVFQYLEWQGPAIIQDNIIAMSVI